MPSGFSEAGLHVSLAEISWPVIEESELPVQDPFQVAPLNIWKPPFVLAFALVAIVLTWAVGTHARSWPAAIAVTGMIGPIGLLEESVALVTLALRALTAAWRCRQALRERPLSWGSPNRAAMGPVLAILLLVVGGGVNSGLAAGSPRDAERLGFGWNTSLGDRRLPGFFHAFRGRSVTSIAGFNKTPSDFCN